MKTMDIHEILRLLPHRYPFLLVDKVLECHKGESISCLKNVSFNEPFFQGHFPARAIMPGVLIIEALAQATGLLAHYSFDSDEDVESLYYLVGIDKARFKRPVEPGEQLILDIKLTRQRRGINFFEAKALIDNKIVASAELMTSEVET